MHKTLSLAILCLLTGIYAAGQEQITAKVRTGDDLNQALAHSRYLFPHFRDARIMLKNASVTEKTNYNALTGQMEFIGPDGEILAIRDNSSVLVILFEDGIFKYSPKGYVEVIAEDASREVPAELAVHRQLKLNDRKKYGAYGLTSETQSISSYSSLSTEAGTVYIPSTEEVTYKKTDTYYVYAGGKYLLANKSGFTKAFGRQRPDLDKYLKEAPVNFFKKDDLIRLFKYCTQAEDSAGTRP